MRQQPAFSVHLHPSEKASFPPFELKRRLAVPSLHGDNSAHGKELLDTEGGKNLYAKLYLMQNCPCKMTLSHP